MVVISSPKGNMFEEPELASGWLLLTNLIYLRYCEIKCAFRILYHTRTNAPTGGCE